MKNIAEKQTVEVYKMLRAEGQPWVASVQVNGKFLNAEGKTPAEALQALANQWPASAA